jgi:hypothetical protein
VGNKANGRLRGYLLGIILAIIPILLIIMATLSISVINEARFGALDIDSKRAFYLAETALNIAYYELSGQGFRMATHTIDGVTPVDPSMRLQASVGNVALSPVDGWYEWSWKPGDIHESFNGTGAPEKFRYMVYFPDASTWEIRVAGIFGSQKKRIKCCGTCEPIFSYAIFDNGDLGEFSRMANQTITGKVHANGSIYFQPYLNGEGQTILTLNCPSSNGPSLTCGGKMVRSRDAWGTTLPNGKVLIKAAGGAYVEMTNGTPGSAFDSENPQWTASGTGALSRWGGVVKDSLLGAKEKPPPPTRSFDPGDYYDRAAGSHIKASTTGSGISDASFYNSAEDHMEHVKDIDLSSYPMPANGLIYCTTPVRIVKGSRLAAPLTVVSTCTIYTKGDFNKNFADHASYENRNVDPNGTLQSAALMTKGRIYHLSEAWKDAEHTGDVTDPVEAGDPSRYSGDPSDETEINACLVDGKPIINQREWVKDIDNPYWVDNNHDGIPDNPAAWQNSDDLLEGFGNKVVKKRGSIVHLQNASMCRFSNSDYGPGKTAWVTRAVYIMPKRDYGYDSAVCNPPMAPCIGKKLYWAEY